MARLRCLNRLVLSIIFSFVNLPSIAILGGLVLPVFFFPPLALFYYAAAGRAAGPGGRRGGQRGAGAAEGRTDGRTERGREGDNRGKKVYISFKVGLCAIFVYKHDKNQHIVLAQSSFE